MGSIDKRPLKAFVRFDGSGRIVASSLILRRKKPKVGKWVEIPAYECCNPTTTTQIPCIQYEAVVGNETVTLTYLNCDGSSASLEIVGPDSVLFCAQQDSPEITGDATIGQGGACGTSITTTTTTTLP